MADVNATRANLLAAYKEVYGDRIAMQANVMPFIYREFEKSKTPFGGKYWTEPLQDEGGQSIGSYNEDEKLADVQAETYKEIRVLPRQHYATIQFSGLAVAAAKRNLYAFFQTKDAEVRSKTAWLISQLNVQCYGAGKGVLGSITTPITNGAAGNFTIDTTQGQTQPTSDNWFRKGMKIDVWTSTFSARRNSGAGITDTTTKNSGGQIASYNKATHLLTLVGTSAAIVAGDLVTFEDAQLTGAAAPADSSGKQLTGLAAGIDDVTEGPQTFQNIDRNVFTIFRGNRLHNSGTRRPMSLKLIQTAFDAAEQASGEPPNMIVSGFGQRAQYLDLLWYDARYEPETFRGGFRILKYNAIDWYVDKDCQQARVYGLNRNYTQKFEIQPIGILDEAGTQMERVPRFDLYELLVGGYFNIGYTRPNSGVKLVDLIEP